MRHQTLIATAILPLLFSACTPEQPQTCSNPSPGFLISNVEVIDGSGVPAIHGAVRLTDGRIAAVGDLERCQDEAMVDGAGQTLVPGFIDTHSHADSLIFEHPDALAAVNQGITTVVVGQDGGSPYPLADFFARLETSPPTVNVASYVGHNTVRYEVMGDDFKRTATAEEIDAMKTMVASEMASGALGLASGLEYEPGIHSATTEVIELAHVAAAAGGRYISHVRSEDRWFEDAIDEIILIGRETGMPVQISHIKLAMRRLWGTSADLIAKLDAARAEGIDVTADIYPYEYWQSTIMVLLPDRDYNNRETIAEVLDQIAPPEGLWMAKFSPNPDYVGKTLTEIAELREIDVVTAFTEIAREAEEMRLETGERTEMIIATSMETADIAALMAWSETNICTDGGLQDRHPRGMGSYPRVLGRYVREQKIMSLETAIHKMTGMAAAHMGMTDRGLIREGQVADLVLFDPDTVIDHATPLVPSEKSEGITSVWVGGELVFAGGMVTTRRPGKVIRREK